MRYIHKIFNDLTGSKYQAFITATILFVLGKLDAYYYIIVVLAFMGLNVADKVVRRFVTNTPTDRHDTPALPNNQ